jgi:hypothetical protein
MGQSIEDTVAVTLMVPVRRGGGAATKSSPPEHPNISRAQVLAAPRCKKRAEKTDAANPRRIGASLAQSRRQRVAPKRCAQNATHPPIIGMDDSNDSIVKSEFQGAYVTAEMPCWPPNLRDAQGILSKKSPFCHLIVAERCHTILRVPSSEPHGAWTVFNRCWRGDFQRGYRAPWLMNAIRDTATVVNYREGEPPRNFAT